MARLSGAAVLLILVVPLLMYTCALFVGIQLGRALERSPDSIDIVSVRGVVQYFAKDLWDTERHRGGRDFVGREPRALQLARTVKPSPPRVLGRSSSRATTGLDNTGTPKIRSYNRNHTSPRGVLSVGPWGGSGGQPFYMRGQSAPLLRSIILYHSTVIHSLACEYSFAGDEPVNRMAGPWGLPHSFGSRAVRATIDLSDGEHVTAVEGTTGRFGNVPGDVITSLTFRTNVGRTYGPYGSKSGTRFSIPAADGSCIAGFWGRSGWLLDAIGAYMKPSCGYSNRAHYYPPYDARGIGKAAASIHYIEGSSGH